jgi:hypothetical protein
VLPQATHVRLKVRIDRIEVRCRQSGPDVDIVYHIIASQIAPWAGGAVEGQKTATRSPQTTSGFTQGTIRSFLPSSLIPSIGFDSTNKLYSGGQLAIPLCGFRGGAAATQSCPLPLQLDIQGQGSQTMATVHAALRATRDSPGPIAHSEYALNYDLSSTPTGAGQIRRALASLQYSGASRAFLGGNVSARFGGLVAKGSEQAPLRTGLPPAAFTSSAVNALKLYAGLDSRLPHNVLSASVGFEPGSADLSSGIQWKKYVGGIHHEFWANVGSRHTIEIESLLAAGAVQGPGPVPVAERFFGGNFEQFFIPGDSWQIPAGPVIRAISGSRFFETAAGAGGDRFLSGNLTAAFSVWQKPLVPAEVRDDPTFTSLLNGQIATATSIDQLHYVTADQHYKEIVTELPNVLAVVNELSDAVSAAQRAQPDQFATQFKACAGAVKMAANRTKSAISASDASRVGLIAALLPVDEDRLNKAIAACGALNALLNSSPGIDVGPLTIQQKNILNLYTGIDQTGAARKAKADMAFVSRTLNTLFHDVNLISISPVVVFDIAQIGPTGPGIPGTRYGPGGGVRLELASAVHFTLGYARNVGAGPGEGSGAIFFSMGLRDLFH